MKSHPSKVSANWTGMYSSVSPDRIDDTFAAYLRNAYCDRSGRVVKSFGASIIATAASFGLTASSAAQQFFTLARFTGRQGAYPNSKALAVLSTKVCRSKDNDLMSRWDDITYATTDETPILGRPMAISFRLGYAYLQNGTDMPFRVKCEQADGSTLTTQADTLGLRPPVFPLQFQSYTLGDARRFPPQVYTSYCVTYVYGDRGESGPSPTLSLYSTVIDGTNDKINFRYMPVGPTGVTARRIYRSPIGRGAQFSQLGPGNFTSGVPVAMYLAHTISDNTTTTWIDDMDDASLDFEQAAPSPRPLVPRSKYQTLHLGRLFWANVKDHTWTVGVQVDLTRGVTMTDYRVTIDNTGNGTITFEKNNSGWSTDFTIANYKTLTLRTILNDMLSSATFGLYNGAYTAGVMAIIPGGLDTSRTYTFNAISQQSIYAAPYWFVAQDNVTGNDGPEVHTDRFYFADPVFPEQVDAVNSDDLTQGGSNEITGMSILDNALVLDSFEDSFAVSGDFVPDPDGLPTFRVDHIQAQAGSICQRPDAVCSVPELGLVMVSKDSLRSVRGERSTVAGEPVYDWFSRVLREPPARDNVAADYDSGVYRIALPVDESP